MLRRVGPSDPPSRAELGRLRKAATEALTGAPSWQPADIVLVGGTSTNLAKITDAATPEASFRIEDLDALDRLLSSTSTDDLVAARAGACWRDRLGPLVHGWAG